jgi:hypothetical protein
MGTGFSLPTNGPWRVRLTPESDRAGIYIVELMDPKAGGVQAGPFLLMFPTPAYAFDWFCEFAQLDDHSQRPAVLEAGDFLTGWADSTTWGPMISAMFHAAETRHRLASPWWYGSYPNWAEVDPLLPPPVAEAQQILLDSAPEPPTEPGERIFGYGIVEFVDGSRPPSPISWVERFAYPGLDGVAMHRIVVHCLTNDSEEFDLLAPPSSDDHGRSLSLTADDSLGPLHLRVRAITGSDEPLLSRFQLGLPPEILVELAETIDKYEHMLGECYEVDYHAPVEELEILFGPDGLRAFAVHYLQATDGRVRNDYWRSDGTWIEDFPTSTEPWRDEFDRANRGSAIEDLLDPDDVEDAMTLWAAATPHNPHPAVAGFLLKRFDEGRLIDAVMMEAAALNPGQLIRMQDLSTEAYTLLAMVLDSRRTKHPASHPHAQLLLHFDEKGDEVTAQSLLYAYMWLVDTDGE